MYPMQYTVGWMEDALHTIIPHLRFILAVCWIAHVDFICFLGSTQLVELLACRVSKQHCNHLRCFCHEYSFLFFFLLFFKLKCHSKWYGLFSAMPPAGGRRHAEKWNQFHSLLNSWDSLDFMCCSILLERPAYHGYTLSIECPRFMVC